MPVLCSVGLHAVGSIGDQFAANTYSFNTMSSNSISRGGPLMLYALPLWKGGARGAARYLACMKEVGSAAVYRLPITAVDDTKLS